MRKPLVGRLLARRWTVLVAVVVVAVAGFAVYRLHGIFGSNNDVSAGGALPNDNDGRDKLMKELGLSDDKG